MTNKELFALKGELTWQIEVAQAQLQQVNQQLIQLQNEQNQTNGTKPQIVEAKGD